MRATNKILLMILGTILVSCSRDETQTWEKYAQARKERGRSPAQSQGQCFKDRFSPEKIRAEVQAIDRDSRTEKTKDLKVSGFLFTGLSAKTHSGLSQDLFIDPSVSPYWFSFNEKQNGCKDLSCFVDRLYANPSSEGVLHSWYVYKTGYAISTLDAYPWLVTATQIDTVKVENTTREDFLFNEKELRAFWLHSQLLPKSLIHLPDLMTIHRIPRGFIPQNWKESGSCAASVGMWNQGYLLLSDECLVLDSNRVMDPSQYFYVALTHELGHRLAAWNFATSPYGPDRDMDQEPDFLKLSGWTEHTVVTKEGKSESQWISSKDAKFITDYAGSNPFEDFAETIGFFRSRADELYAKAPEKYEYIKNKVFGGRGYSKDDLKIRYSDSIKTFLVDSVNDWTNVCLSGKPEEHLTFTHPRWAVAAKVLEIDLPVDETVKLCLQTQFINQIAVGLLNIRVDEPEGCDLLDQYEEQVMTASVLKAAPAVIDYFRTSPRIADLLSAVKSLRTLLQLDFDGRTVFLKCLSDSDPQKCYETRLESETHLLFEKHREVLVAGAETLAEAEKNRFIAVNSFSEVSSQVLEFYQAIAEKYVDQMQLSAQSIWRDCRTQIGVKIPSLLTEPYHGGLHTIPPGVLNCINQKTTTSLVDLETAIAKSEGFDYFSPGASEWMKRSILFPRFKTWFDAQVQSESQTEAKRLSEIKGAQLEAVYGEMKQKSFSQTGCKTQAVSKLGERFKASAFPFTSLEPIFDEASNNICDRLKIASKTANGTTNPVPSQVQKKDLEPVWSTIQPVIVKVAATRFQGCAKKKKEKDRRFCLFSERVSDSTGEKVAWAWIKEKAIQEWVTQASVRQRALQRGYSDTQIKDIARERLEDERQFFSDLIFKEFSRKAVSGSTR